MGWVARGLLQGRELAPPFVTGWLSHPMLWFYLQAAALGVFGDDIAGLRMLSALLGAATPPLLYVFARPLYGRATAALAAVLLASYHFHIHYSRLGVNNIADPLLALVAFIALLHGFRQRSALGFALAGLALGAAQHFYMGSRLTPLIVLGVLAHQALFDRARLLRLRGHLGLLALGFVLGFGPLLLFFANHPDDYNARMVLTSIVHSDWFPHEVQNGRGAPEIIIEQLRLGFGAYTFVPERSTFYDTGMPLLDHTSSTLFLLGTLLALVRVRRVESGLLLGWLAGTALFGGVLMISLSSPRYVTAAPALCLLMALAVAQLGELLRWTARLPRPATLAAMGLCVAALSAWNLQFYFREYTPLGRYGGVNTEVSSAIAAFLREQPADTYAYMFGAPRLYVDNGTVRFAAPHARATNVMEPIDTPADLAALPQDARPLFIFLPERLAELDVVRRRYPEGELTSASTHERHEEMVFFYRPETP
jgi:4-amino-4-deoxy-L-arabinose transferase-like glycosyltransferase